MVWNFQDKYTFWAAITPLTIAGLIGLITWISYKINPKSIGDGGMFIVAIVILLVGVAIVGAIIGLIAGHFKDKKILESSENIR